MPAILERQRVGASAGASQRGWSPILLRAASVTYMLFAAGHTFGAMFNDTHRGLRQAELFSAMRSYTFDAQGATRSYWDFYRGFGFMVAVLLGLLAALSWVLADLGRSDPRQTRCVLVVLVIASAFTTWFSFAYFFALPMVFSVIGLSLLVAATTTLHREAAQNRAWIDNTRNLS